MRIACCDFASFPASCPDVSGGEYRYGVNVHLFRGQLYDMVLEYVHDAKEPVGVQVRYTQKTNAVLRQ